MKEQEPVPTETPEGGEADPLPDPGRTELDRVADAGRVGRVALALREPERIREDQAAGERVTVDAGSDRSPQPYLSAKAKQELDELVDELTAAAVATTGVNDPELIERIRRNKRSRVYREYRPYGFHRVFADQLKTSAQ